MGKPVRGEGQLPFGIGGFLVSGSTTVTATSVYNP